MPSISLYFIENPILILLFICHFLSDFHLQSQKIADRKQKDKQYLLIHLLWVAIPLLLILALQAKLWLTILLILASHAAIDDGKPILSRFFKLAPSAAFLIDQCLHLVVILVLSPLYQGLNLPSWLSGQVLSMILFLVLISKPTNVAFRIFFQRFQPADVEKMDTIAGAGATIGLLERIVIGTCIAFGQFASIGLVFTAKSIARYNKISESPAFAEYYLIGSLFSILSALLAAWLCFY